MQRKHFSVDIYEHSKLKHTQPRFELSIKERTHEGDSGYSFDLNEVELRSLVKEASDALRRIERTNDGVITGKELKAAKNNVGGFVPEAGALSSIQEIHD